MKILNAIKRVLVSPAILLLLIVSHNWFVVKRTIHFLIYGGEFIQYDKDEYKTIKEIYEEIKDNRTK
jgi:hypothetical protein